jgi:chromate transporter
MTKEILWLARYGVSAGLIEEEDRIYTINRLLELFGMDDLVEEELLDIITIAESTPGPIAINMATYVGYKKKKILGSLCATLGVVLPSFIIIYIISLFLQKFMEFEIVQYLFVGINCAVAFLIVKTGFSLLKNIEKH